MSKLKNLTLGLATLWSVAAMNAQQTLQKITQGTNTTIVELFHLRNGNSNSNVIGPAGRNQDISNTSGSDIFYLESTGLSYDQWSSGPLPTQNFPTEQIGNGTFDIATTPYNNNRAQKLFNWKNNGTVMPWGELTLNNYNTDRDALEDGNSNVDLLHSKRVLPHMFDNGAPLPDGIWIILRAREGKKDTGWSVLWDRIGFRRSTSSLSRVPLTQDRYGISFDIPQSTLDTPEFQTNKKGSIVYPNPTRDEVYISDGDNNEDETQIYHIYDATGRQVATGKRTEGQPIRLGQQTNGIYIIKTSDSEGDTTRHKIVKQ